MNTKEHIKAGDRVWIENGIFRTLKTVTKVTPIYIVIVEGDTRKMYERLSGRPHGYHSGWIKGVATPEEIAAWEAEQARKAEVQKQRQDEQSARDTLRQELGALVPYFRLETGDDSNLWNLVLVDRTPEQVREIAALLNGAR